MEKIKTNNVFNNNLISKVTNYEEKKNQIKGLDQQIDKMMNIINYKINNYEYSEKKFLPSGILLYGASGTGKTSVLNLIKSKYGNNNVYDLIKLVRDQKMNNNKSYAGLDLINPKIFVIDDFNELKRIITPDYSRPEIKEVVNDVVSGLFKVINKNNKNIFIVTAKNKNNVDLVFKKAELIEVEIELPLPNKQTKKQILESYRDKINFEKNIDFNKIIELTPGFSGAELVLLIRKSVLNAVDSIQDLFPNNYNYNNKIIVSNENFVLASKQLESQGIKNYNTLIPNKHWGDIGGLREIVDEIKNDVVNSLKHSEILEKYGLEPIKGILLYGPPGTGKTLLAQIIANESGFNFISINAPDIYNKYLGESEKNIRKIFAEAKQNAPSVLFIDEIDGIGSHREPGRGSDAYNSVINTLLSQINGIEKLKNVIVIGATNKKDILDNALLRSGRFDKYFEIKLPDEKARADIFKIFLNKFNLINNDEFNKKLAHKTEKYSGADIENICLQVAREIALKEIIRSENKRQIKKITINNLDKKFENIITKKTPKKINQRKIGFELSNINLRK